MVYNFQTLFSVYHSIKELEQKFNMTVLMCRISLIIQGCSMVYYSIWPRNHTSHKKFYFNEFVVNVMQDVIGIVIFDLRGHGGH